jgi:hypothetical protein
MIRIIMRSVFATYTRRELLSGVDAFHHLLSLFEEGDSMPREFARLFFRLRAARAWVELCRDRFKPSDPCHFPGRFEDKWASMSREQDVFK